MKRFRFAVGMTLFSQVARLHRAPPGRADWLDGETTYATDGSDQRKLAASAKACCDPLSARQ